MLPKNKKIAIIGLGYVGLPLAVEFARKFPTTGFDINPKRVDELNAGHDRTLEVDNTDLKSVLTAENTGTKNGLLVTTDPAKMADCNVYIITVPTPTDKHNRPVLTPLRKASETAAKVLKKGDVVVYESTVYPGVTEDECVPILEEISGLVYNSDFYIGYSPARINPGDKEHTVTKIKKVTSGSTPKAARFVDALYNEVITAGTHLAPTIKVAEASKVIENAQRDINIAFVNELSKIFNLLDIDTGDVLEAAGTKWNFLKFKPGLVGGDCLSIDPYYPAQIAYEVNYHPEIFLAARRMNNSMGKYMATEVVKTMKQKGMKMQQENVLMLGITFKENCPDIRNTRVIDIYRELQSYDMNIDVFDPWADPAEVKKEFGIALTNGSDLPNLDNYSVIILAVAHDTFRSLPIQKNGKHVVFDVKGFLKRELVDKRF